MKITFVSNFSNHHQIPFCEALEAMQDIDFCFIATEKVSQERIALGYLSDFSSKTYYKEINNNISEKQAEEICFESDVVIIGSAPESYVKRRIKQNKLTFSYNERFFKSGFWKHPGDIYRTFNFLSKYNKKNFYLLCASAYTASDAKKVGFFNKCFKWGYFPKTKNAADKFESLKSNSVPKLLWVGRMISWKRPEIFLNACKQALEKGIPFTADIIGGGELEESICNFIAENGLSELVIIHKSMPADEVRKYMESADIFMFTSNKQEGWGAVLNEAMNSACAVVASKTAGATNFLVSNGKNGLVFENDNMSQAIEQALMLLSNTNLRKELGNNAYSTVTELWNAEISANRFVELCDNFYKTGKLISFKEGPLSKA